MRTFLSFLCLIFFLVPALADVSTEDSDAVQSVIDGQIKAFLKDDGETAYGFTAPHIKNFFPSADAFMSMVKNGYRPVYRPRSYRFGETKGNGTTIGQTVLIEDVEGVAYEAFYQLEKQKDGTWKIGGVFLRKLPQADA